MEYERIQKVQAGALSPTKLRMKLLGAHNRVRVISNTSSRTSPSKNTEPSQAQSRLLVCDVLDEVSDSSDGSKRPSAAATKAEAAEKEVALNGNGSSKVQSKNTSKASSAHQPAPSNSSMIHPVRSAEEDSNDCDSGLDNASTSSFEFHGGGGEKPPPAAATTAQNPTTTGTGPYFSRQTSSKWNDAEKWIMNKQQAVVQQQQQQSHGAQHQMNSAASSRGAIVPKIAASHGAFARPVQQQSQSMKRLNPSSRGGILERFSFASHQPRLVRHSDVCPVNSSSNATFSEHQDAANCTASSLAMKPCNDPKAAPVSLRDVGTEMTPIPSQDPSRTGTPLGSMTPTRSPNCSIPSTPVGGRSTASPGEDNADDGPYFNRKGGTVTTDELSDNEMRLKTRKEIAALGIQLGKMNIATWASKEELELVAAAPSIADLERMRKEYAARAASYEEVENSKHTARFKKEEVRIEAWERSRRAKIETEMRRIEEHVEKMRSDAMARMAEKLEITRRHAEEKRASANARMNQQAARAVHKAEQIRQTGSLPGSHILCCSSCFCEP